MKSFLKLSIAAVVFGAMTFAAGFASAAEVAKNDNGTLDISGMGSASFGMFQGYEDAAGEAPPSTFATATDVRLNVTYGNDTMKAKWSKWVRDVDGGRGNITQDMAQVTWKPSAQLRIDMGNIIYLPWGDRAILWENYYTVSSVHQSGTYAGYPEDVNGLDIGFDVGSGIEVGAGVFSQGLVGGFANRTDTASIDGDGDGVKDTFTVASTIVPHLIWSQDTMSLRLAYYMESAEGGPNWGESDTVSNTLISATFKINVGVNIGLTFNSSDGDNWEDVDPPTTIAFSVRMPLGENNTEAGIEGESVANGGVDDKGEQADTTYFRVFYQMGVAVGSTVQVEYEMADNAISTASELSLNFKQMF